MLVGGASSMSLPLPTHCPHPIRFLLLATCLLLPVAGWALDRAEVRSRASALVAAKDLWGMLQLHRVAADHGLAFRSPYSEIAVLGPLLFTIPDWGRQVFVREDRIVLVGNEALRAVDLEGAPLHPMVPLAHGGRQVGLAPGNGFLAAGQLILNRREKQRYLHHALQRIPDGEVLAGYQAMALPTQRLGGTTLVAQDGSAAICVIHDIRGPAHSSLVIYGPDLDPVLHPGFHQPSALGHRGAWAIARGSDNGWYLLSGADARPLADHAVGPGCYVLRDAAGDLQVVDERGESRALTIDTIAVSTATLTSSDGFLILTGTTPAAPTAPPTDDLLAGLGATPEAAATAGSAVTVALPWSAIIAGKAADPLVLEGHWSVDENHWRRLLRTSGHQLLAYDLGSADSPSGRVLVEMADPITGHHSQGGHRVVVDSAGTHALLGPTGAERWRGPAQMIWRSGLRHLIVKQQTAAETWLYQLVTLEAELPGQPLPPPVVLPISGADVSVTVDQGERGILCQDTGDESWLFLHMDGSVADSASADADGKQRRTRWGEQIPVFDDGWELRGGMLRRCDAGRAEWGWHGPSDVTETAKGPLILDRCGGLYLHPQRGTEIEAMGVIPVHDGQLLPDERSRRILVTDSQRRALAILDNDGDIDRRLDEPSEPVPEFQIGPAPINGHAITFKTTGPIYWHSREHQIPARRMRCYGRGRCYVVTTGTVLAMDAKTFQELAWWPRR
jgi:hypothetical protein